MKTGPTLIHRETQGLEPLGAFSQPVSRNHSQIRAALLQSRGPVFADYFSRPDFDRDGTHVSWISTRPGTARRWVDLEPAERDALEPMRRRLHEGFASYLDELARNDDRKTSSNFRKILEQALLCPSLDHLYVVTREPAYLAAPGDDGSVHLTLAFWGYRAADRQAGFNPLISETRVPLPPPAAAAPAAAAAIPTAEVAAAAVAERPRRSWLGALLWALVALLLLLLFLLLLWWHQGYRLGLPEFPLSLDRFWPFSQSSGDDKPPADNEGWHLPDLGFGAGEPSDGGSKPEPRGDDSANTPRPSTPTAPNTPAAPGAPASPAAPAGGDREKPKPAPPGSAAAPAAPSSPVAPERRMVLPREMSDDLSAVEGYWNNRSDLTLGGRPVDVFFRVEPDGKSRVFVKLPNEKYCEGPLDVATQQDGITFSTLQPVTCPNGAAPPLNRVTCLRQGDGTAACSGVNLSPDGEEISKFNVELVRVDGLP